MEIVKAVNPGLYYFISNSKITYMPGETNSIQAGINKLIEKLKNEKGPSSQQRSQRKK